MCPTYRAATPVDMYPRGMCVPLKSFVCCTEWHSSSTAAVIVRDLGGCVLTKIMIPTVLRVAALIVANFRRLRELDSDFRLWCTAFNATTRPLLVFWSPGAHPEL